MANGRLRCIGSQQHLKNRFGDGYKLEVSTEPAADADALQAFVGNEVCEGAQLSHSFSSTMFTFSLPKEQVVVSHVFNAMERNKARIGIQNWGITQASLEEVFVKIALESE